ncbi:hypothetical protein TRFO_09146 [Tritrichomonas foetus]|uniref:Protein kinase domain-containing protein n=1 Tax=Tritrichomonas foetus TaxID=1144522 RepID=A0A1J4JFR1_9EUKA|nr:hypothetical protein TRFO_09146 [Tritrichomonas foetus]|eukprot:OHS97986.1 hypothetical protein TRFO_09146 [Tritrichomonas foetus]
MNIDTNFLPSKWYPEPEKNVVSQYNVIKELYRDDSSQIVVASREPDKRIFTIKRIMKSKLVSEKARHIQRELDIMYALKHPNIFSLFEYFEDDNCFNFVMPGAPDGNLRKNIEKNGRLRETHAATIIYQIFQALNYLHKNGIFFGNLSSDCIFFQSFPNKLRIGSFLNASMEENSNCQHLNFYSPPELFEKNDDDDNDTFLNVPVQKKPKNKLNEKSDIWCVGILLYEMVTGNLPWKLNGSNEQIVSQIQNGKIPIPSNVSEPCADVIKAILCVNPRERVSYERLLHFPWMNLGIPKKIHPRNEFKQKDFQKITQPHPFHSGLCGTPNSILNSNHSNYNNANLNAKNDNLKRTQKGNFSSSINHSNMNHSNINNNMNDTANSNLNRSLNYGVNSRTIRILERCRIDIDDDKMLVSPFEVPPEILEVEKVPIQPKTVVR